MLVLNQSYEPVSVCNAKKAFLLLFMMKAEVVAERENRVLRSVNASYPFPSVIRLSAYIRVPFKKIELSRKNILRRDNFKCQYCSSNAGRHLRTRPDIAKAVLEATGTPFNPHDAEAEPGDTPTGAGSLAERFGIPPFSVLNAREGWWQDRKRAWLALGIQSELGRGEQLIPNGGGAGSKARYDGGQARAAR